MDRKLSLLGPLLLALTLFFNCVSSDSVVPVRKFLTVPGANDKPCLLATSSGATAKLYKKDSKQEVILKFADPEIPKSAKCAEDKTANRADELTLNIGDLTVSFSFSHKGTNWDYKPTSVKIKNQQDYVIGKNTPLANSHGFSYSCQKEIIPVSNNEYESGFIIIEGFQVQPYYNKDSPKDSPIRFDDSADCAVWFTLPLFSGLIVVLLLITILHFGVYALMSISTPDRFENPKSGRALIITNFEE